MQKEFDLIVERLEELNIENSCQDCRYRGVCDKVEETATGSTDLCGATMRYLALEIVNQVAEEYKQEVCEWKQCGEYLRPYQTTSCEKFALYDISYVYCPYCGKKIKVVEQI